MFALPSLVLLVLVDTLKPQEYVPFLQSFPALYVLTALTLAGFVVDVRLGLTRLAAAPQLVLALLFAGWCVVTVIPRGGHLVLKLAFHLLILYSLYIFVAHAVQSFRGLRVLLGLVLAIGLFLAAVGVHQAYAPWGCHRISYVDGGRDFLYDGRECSAEDRTVCNRGDFEPGSDYVCERLGT